MIAGTRFQIVDIDDVWPRIAQRARRCRADPDVLQDARARCHAGGDAVCLEGPDGVLIMAAAGPVAMVLLAVSSGLPGAFHREEEAMLAIARDLRAQTVTFQTDRRGWARLLGPAWQQTPDGAFTRSL